MKRLTEAGITLEPRSSTACLDLAFRHLGRRWLWLGVLTLLMSVPPLVVTVLVAQQSNWGWLAAIASVLITSPILGVALVADTASIAFRDPLTVGRLLRLTFVDSLPLLVQKLAVRCVIFCVLSLVIPAVLLVVMTGYWTESHMLQRFRRQAHDHRTRDLVKLEFSDLVVRVMLMGLFGGALWFLLMILVDAVLKVLFDVSPILGTLADATHDPWGYRDSVDVSFDMWAAIFTDSRILSIAVLTAMATYTVLRLAWFFSYVDLRIRRDCWDLEVALADEAERWSTVP